ncbi:histidine phosphatase family protein [Streptomyces sp. NPDC005813]|uniref:histidine phosphatase family protein n=1 Tax=Streptomyces sp. NPDC005813 TaxID=3155592 RepID=UPI0033F5C54F
MTVSLTFVCATDGDATRALSGQSPCLTALRGAGSATPASPAYSLAVRGPSARCAHTADALGLEATPEPALRDFDHGAWDGYSVAEVAAKDPYGYSVWFTDPDAAPHGGESIRQICRRTGNWLSGLPPHPGQAVAVTEPSVVRAALVHALSTPMRAFWHFDLPPLSAVTLTRRDGHWRVHPGCVILGRSGRWLVPPEAPPGPRVPELVRAAHSGM